ncbi:MAG: host attachment protein [Leptospiraceae bacterium]|nr:host attachment protein [Leptospiraceae bacterium]MDW7975656.1 host attachment protein [Leptospiraceae bacterium]
MNLTRKWIVVADQSKARIFEYQGPGKPFKLIKKFEHPEGRMKIYSNDGGESFDRAGYGRHKTEPVEDPKEVENKRFASEISEYLKQSKLDNKYDYIYIASGPSFLGYLKEKLDSNVSRNVQAWISKNLANIEDREIHLYFKDYLNV